MPIYLTGAPGAGKSTLASRLSKSYTLIPELPDDFPIDKYPDPRSFETAQYILEQNKKRNQIIKETAAIDSFAVIDRHPLENILIARAYLKEPKHFEEIQKAYLNFEGMPGQIVHLDISDELQRERVELRKLAQITTEMFRDIFHQYSDYNKYLTPDLILDAEDSLESHEENIKALINNLVLMQD